MRTLADAPKPQGAEGLAALVAKWRKQAAEFPGLDLEGCADELEAALAASGTQSHPPKNSEGG